MDVLSEVLKVVKMDSAFFFNAEFSAPWSLKSPDSCKYVPHLHGTNGRVIIYHLVLEGAASVRLGKTRVELTPGDIVIFPHGSEHFLENGRGCPSMDAERELPRIFAEGLKLSKLGGGGEITKFVCGFMVCEARLSDIFLAGLPLVFKVNIRTDQSGQWLENSIQYAIAAASASGAGGDAVVAKLCETLFIETLRRYIVQLPERQAGWLAGVRDPMIGKVLALMHSKPETPWTIANLASEVGVSRSVLAERLREYLGETPMAYLANWRLQLGAQMLQTTSYSVAQIAGEVGYESEQAFNRAFKRKFEQPPARFRTMAKTAGMRA
jgi:AraC-like DNA-binding protein